MLELIAQNNAAHFSYGACENTTIYNESVALCQTAGRYIQAGCYTTQAYNCAPFTHLAASACCDTPCKTAFELLIRVMVNGTWSAWLSYGKYSPHIKRCSNAQTNDFASLENGILTVSARGGAEAFQLMVYLYSDNPLHTPLLNMVSASIKPLYPQSRANEITMRELPVPAYSQMVRSPALCGKISLPTAAAMLLNRHGEDILPEQAAHAMLDYKTDAYDNISFAASLCGAFGYDSACVFCDIAYIKKEIRYGYALAAVTERGALVVRGFSAEEESDEYILINDPKAETDESSVCSMLISEFESIYSGVCLLLHDKRKGAGTCAPQCRPASLQKDENGEYMLYVAGIPAPIDKSLLQENGNVTGTVCACAKNTTAFASAAQKSFEYLSVSDNGGIIIPPQTFTEGTKITLYVIDHSGSAYAAEIKV